MTIYLVEVIQLNRIVKVKERTRDYDRANTTFKSLKRESCREVRMLKVANGVRVLLKYLTRARQGNDVFLTPA